MKRILVVDNYDSFTYNLVQYLGELGAEVLVWRNDEFTPNEVEQLNPAGIVISPGPCTPNEAGVAVELIRIAAGRFPIYGVCLGHQAIAAAFGAKIERAETIMHGKTSTIRHDGTGTFLGLKDGIQATRYHSLVVKDLPAELQVNAWADDAGESVVMGFRHAEWPVWGVQFHPESILTEEGHPMLQNFLDLC
jgi:anthranilate synthase component 2